MGNYNYQIISWPAQPRSKKRREANIAAGGGSAFSGGGAGMADMDLSGYIRVADLIKTTSETSASDFLDTNALSSLMVKSLLDQKANTIHDHASQLIRPAVMVVPQQDPSDAGFSLSSGEIAEFISHEGSFAEEASSVTPADLKDLTLKINGVVKTTYNPSSAASFNVDLTSYATQSWVEAKNYLLGITKAMVEAVLTGNITSHTHSQYLTSHQSLSGYATQTWVQQQGYLTSHQSLANYYTKTQADAKFLTEHQSLADYALKTEIPTSMAWSAITGKPTKLSDLTNDIISSWALSATKPSYSWTEINSRPTTLSAFADDATHRLVSDEQISGWNRAYGELIMGTQTAATGSWTGVSRLATASDMTSGYRFSYWLPYAGSGNASLTLTFADGTTKTINLYIRGTSRLTTHYPAGTKIDFVYFENISIAGSTTLYTGAWPDAYYDSTVYDRLYSTYERTYIHSTATPLYRYKLCGYSAEGKIVPLTVTNQTSGTIVDKTPTTVPINPKKGIVYYNTTTNITATTTAIASLYNECPLSTGQYTFNTNVPAYADIFLKGSYDENSGLFTLDTSTHTSWYVFALKTDGQDYNSVFTDGSYYIYIGPSYSSANYVQLKNDNPLYVFKNGKLIPLELTALTTSWSDVVGRPTKLSDFSNDIISSWALAATKPSYSWSEIGSRPTKLSQFTNDILSSWALASTKPAYSFSELNNKPTTLAGYGILDSITFTISNQYVGARFANAEIASKAHDTYIECWQTNAGWFNFKTGAIESTANITAINFLGKLDWSYIQNKPTTLSGYGITDGYSSLTTSGSGNAITAVSGTGHSLTFTKGNTFVDLASEQTISGKKHISYLDVTGALAIPQVEPTAESGKVFEYISTSGEFGGSDSAVTPADLKDLTLKINGVVKTTYNPSSAASFNVDLTSYATQSWVEAKNYLLGITKAMVEAVLTGNITSHTHSQYLTSHQSLSGYATQTWVQQQGYLTSHQSLANYYTKTQADAKFLTEHQSLENYALKSEIPTSMAWTSITGRPTKLSQFTNDIISSWALAASKPSYSWSEITSRPTSLSAFSEDSSHRLVTDAQIAQFTNTIYAGATSTSDTRGHWTAQIDGISSLYDGLTIKLRLNTSYYGSGESYNTLNVNGLGPKVVWYSYNNRLTTHYGTYAELILTYRTSAGSYKVTTSTGELVNGTTYTDGWVIHSQYYSDSDYRSANYYFRYMVNSDGYIGRYMLVMLCPDGTITGLTKTNNSVGTSKTMFSGPLLMDSVFYYSSTNTYAAGAKYTHDGATMWNNYSLIDVRYTFNCGATLKCNNPFFIVGNIGDDGYFYLDQTKPWADEYPTEDDGKIYIRLGVIYPETNTAAGYRVCFEANNTAYVYKYGRVMEYSTYADAVVSNTLRSYYTKAQADAKFLTSHQSLANYALKSEIPTSMAWSSITGRPTKLSQFTNDIISSWALAASKPSYSWSEITSRPTTLASFSGDSTHRLVTDTQISNWNSAYGWGNHADAGYLTSFTESDPTVPAWAKTTTKPSYTLDEVTDGTTRKLSNYVPTTRTINSKALSGNITLTLDDIANGTNRSLANYLPLSGGTLTGYVTFNTSSDKSIYANNGTLNQRVMLMSNSGNLSIGYDLPGNSKYLYLDGYQTYLRFGSSKNYSMTLWSDGTIRSSTGTNLLSIGYRSGNTIYPFKNVYSTINVSTKCAGTMGGTMLYGVARFAIQNTKKARTFAIKIPSSMGAYVTFKIVLYSPFNLSPSSTITVSAGAFNLTATAYCALYPSCAIEGSFAGRVAFARDGNTSSANMYILLGSCNDTDALYQGGMIAIDSIIHADNIANADAIMNFGYELLDLDSESMFTKITECVNADAHFKSVTVEDHVTAPKIDCTSMMLVPTIEPSSVPAGKVAEYIDLTGSFAN